MILKYFFINASTCTNSIHFRERHLILIDTPHRAPCRMMCVHIMNLIPNLIIHKHSRSRRRRRREADVLSSLRKTGNCFNIATAAVINNNEHEVWSCYSFAIIKPFSVSAILKHFFRFRVNADERIEIYECERSTVAKLDSPHET